MPDDIWLLNGYTGVYEEGQHFFITFISRFNSWHRLNIVVKRSRATDSTGQTIDTKISTATAAWPEDGSQMIYGYVRGLLQEAIFGNIITRLVIGNDGSGKVNTRSRPDKKELARLSNLGDQRISWQVPVVKDIMYARHVEGYTYKVYCELKEYTFRQIPDLDMLDDSLYELHVLNSTVGCKYMSNLAYVVYDESEQNIRGYLLDEHPYQESLHAVLKRLYERGSLVPWYVRRRWAIQIVSAVYSLHAAGVVHGGLSLKTISLVPGPDYPAETVAAATILVACPDKHFPDAFARCLYVTRARDAVQSHSSPSTLRYRIRHLCPRCGAMVLGHAGV